MHTINQHSMILGLSVMLATAACSHSGRSTEPAIQPVVRTKTIETPSVTPTTVVNPTVSETGSTGTESTYSTRSFGMPFDITVPTWLRAEPNAEQLNYVAWYGRVEPDRAVRFLIPVRLYPPVSVYPPDSTGTSRPPKDYLAYLLGLADNGAHLSVVTKTTVGGWPASIVTATTDHSLNGALGCPEEGIAAPDCFGLQPEYVLRIAVVDTGDKTLLAWLRNDVAAADDMTSEIKLFDQLLAKIRFIDRAVQAPTTTPPMKYGNPFAGATNPWTKTG